MKGYKPPYTCLCGEVYMNLQSLRACLVKHMRHRHKQNAWQQDVFTCWCDTQRAYRFIEDVGFYGPTDFAKHMLKKGMHAHYLEHNLGESHDSNS